MKWFTGVLLIGLSASAFGAMPLFAHAAYASGASPTTVLFLRFALASLCLLAITVMRNLPVPRGSHLLALILMGAVGFVLQSLTYFTALTLIPAGLVALLLYLYPAIVAGMAIVLWKEPVTKFKAVALGLALAGMVLTVGAEGYGNLLGILLGLSSACVYAGYVTAGGTIMQREAAIPACLVMTTSAAIVLSLLVVLQGAKFPTTGTGWAAISAIALISTVLAIGTLFAGIKRIGSTNAATLSTLEPVVTVILAALFLGEAITPMRTVGGLLILAAVVILTKGELQLQTQ